MNQAEQTKEELERIKRSLIDELAGFRLRLSNYLVQKMKENMEAYSTFHVLAKSKPNDPDLIRSRDWHRAQISFIHSMAEEFGIEHEALKYSEVMIERFRLDSRSDGLS
ncbi:MAG: hypothetical protein KAU06_04800 [Candidatus Marinimicrobia bacterium]|nr:hypothetical protein [Candidatus Neomarinimicrobiota bacterium]